MNRTTGMGTCMRVKWLCSTHMRWHSTNMYTHCKVVEPGGKDPPRVPLQWDARDPPLHKSASGSRDRGAHRQGGTRHNRDFRDRHT